MFIGSKFTFIDFINNCEDNLMFCFEFISSFLIRCDLMKRVRIGFNVNLLTKQDLDFLWWSWSWVCMWPNRVKCRVSIQKTRERVVYWLIGCFLSPTFFGKNFGTFWHVLKMIDSRGDSQRLQHISKFFNWWENLIVFRANRFKLAWTLSVQATVKNVNLFQKILNVDLLKYIDIFLKHS